MVDVGVQATSRREALAGCDEGYVGASKYEADAAVCAHNSVPRPAAEGASGVPATATGDADSAEQFPGSAHSEHESESTPKLFNTG